MAASNGKTAEATALSFAKLSAEARYLSAHAKDIDYRAQVELSALLAQAVAFRRSAARRALAQELKPQAETWLKTYEQEEADALQTYQDESAARERISAEADVAIKAAHAVPGAPGGGYVIEQQDERVKEQREVTRRALEALRVAQNNTAIAKTTLSYVRGALNELNEYQDVEGMPPALVEIADWLATRENE